jgi:ankyrin repeat protein
VKKDALHKAAHTGKIDEVRRLLNQGGDVNARNADGDTILWLAAHGGHTEVVRLLVDAGAEINATHPSYGSALIGPLMNKERFDVMQLLIDRGLDPNVTNAIGYSPLMLAARNGSAKAARFLLDNGAKVDAENNEGKTALMFADWDLLSTEEFHRTPKGKGKPPLKAETTRLLLERGANPNHKANRGVTPLIEAACRPAIDKTLALIEAGARINDEDDKGRTALTLAIERNHADIMELLRQNGAK